MYVLGILVLIMTLLKYFWVLTKQAWQCFPGKELAWNLLTLFTASGMLCLEISLVAYLLQEDYTSCIEALARTFIVSGITVGLHTLLKVPSAVAWNLYMYSVWCADEHEISVPMKFNEFLYSIICDSYSC